MMGLLQMTQTLLKSSPELKSAAGPKTEHLTAELTLELQSMFQKEKMAFLEAKLVATQIE